MHIHACRENRTLFLSPSPQGHKISCLTVGPGQAIHTSFLCSDILGAQTNKNNKNKLMETAFHFQLQ